MNILRKIVFLTTVVFLIFSCGKKEELVPDTACKLSKIYANGAIHQVYEYNQVGKLAKISYYAINYFYSNTYDPNPKIYEEYIFEYDNNQRLMGYKSRFSPILKSMKFGYENDKVTSFVMGGYDDMPLGKILYNPQNQIKSIRIDYADNNYKILNYSYYDDGNVRSIDKLEKNSWGTSTNFNEFLDYDKNSLNPFLNVQPLVYNYLLQIDNQYQIISNNNPQKIINKYFNFSPTQTSQTNFEVTLNKYKYPKNITFKSETYSPYPYPITYEYEYENCQ
jgi:hypothetical protein